jgi:nucleotide-binding universal stress UspA family protein
MLGRTRELQITILNRLASVRDMTITLIAVVSAEEKADTGKYLTELEGMFEAGGVTSRVVVDDDPVHSILVEAERDYDLMILGTPTVAHPSEGLFGRMIDDLVKLSPCPTLLVRGTTGDEGLRRILVPTNGTNAARRAAELAFAIATERTEVEGLHVITPSTMGASRERAAEVTAELELVGDAMGKTPRTRVRHGETAEAGIIAYIDEIEPDLLILGTEVRAGTTRLHLGPRVESLVRSARCPVVVINA